MKGNKGYFVAKLSTMRHNAQKLNYLIAQLGAQVVQAFSICHVFFEIKSVYTDIYFIRDLLHL